MILIRSFLILQKIFNGAAVSVEAIITNSVLIFKLKGELLDTVCIDYIVYRFVLRFRKLYRINILDPDFRHFVQQDSTVSNN